MGCSAASSTLPPSREAARLGQGIKIAQNETTRPQALVHFGLVPFTRASHFGVRLFLTRSQVENSVGGLSGCFGPRVHPKLPYDIVPETFVGLATKKKRRQTCGRNERIRWGLQGTQDFAASEAALKLGQGCGLCLCAVE